MKTFKEFLNESPEFYTADHKFFKPGTKWDEGCTTIDKVETFGDGEWDATVHYTQVDGTKAKKDIWHFQIRHDAPGVKRKKGPTPEELEKMEKSIKNMPPDRREKQMIDFEKWKSKQT